LVILTGVKLSEWAGISGVSRQSATWWLNVGVLPVPAWQLVTGTVLAGAPGRAAAGVAVYAGVWSCGQRSDLGWQVAWLAGYLTAEGIAPLKVVSRVGSGRNGHRTGMLGLLRDASAGTMVAGPWEGLARFGVDCREAALAARGRELIVAGQAGVGGGLVRGMVEVCTSLCARRYGRRPAKHRAELALAAVGGDRAG
jgi:putative resolvase